MRETERQHSDPTLAFWQQRSARELTPEDAREIRSNLCGFVQVLLAWRARAADADRERANSESRAQAEAGDGET